MSTEGKRDKMTDNDLQNITQNIKKKFEQHESIWNETGTQLVYSESVGNTCSTSGTRHVTRVKNMVVNHECGKEGIVVWNKWNILGHLWHK